MWGMRLCDEDRVVLGLLCFCLIVAVAYVPIIVGLWLLW